jgi:hypothetical protein
MLGFFSFLLAGLFAASPASASGPTLAVEDTMHTEVAEVLVRAPRVTLDEILDRVARGEARRESLLVDQSFTGTVRLVRGATKREPAGPVMESVWRVYRKRPDRVRTVLLRRWEAKPKKNGKGSGMQFDFSPGMGEDIVNFAFQANARREFRYRIVSRALVGNHVIYKIAFEPRSLLSPFAPSGLVWVDTNEFVIVREEVSFLRSPIPVLVQGIPRMVVERQRSGPYWVLSRVLMRIQMVTTFPTVGRTFDLSIHYDDYRLNQGIADSLFVRGERP